MLCACPQRYKELNNRKYNLRPHSDGLRQGTREADPDYTSESNSDDEENLAFDPSGQNKRQLINWSVDMNRFILQTYEALKNKATRGRGYLNVLMHKNFCKAFPEIKISVKQLAYRRSLLVYSKNNLSSWEYVINHPEDNNNSAKAHNKSRDTSITNEVKKYSVTKERGKDTNENDHNVNDKNAISSAFKGHCLLQPRVELQRYGPSNNMKEKYDNHFHTTKENNLANSNSLSDRQNANVQKQTNTSSSSGDESDRTSNDIVYGGRDLDLTPPNTTAWEGMQKHARSDSTSASDSDDEFHVNTPPETKLAKRQRINWSYDMDKYIWRTYLSLQKKGVRRFLRVLYEKFCRAFPETDASVGQLAERRMLLALYNDEMTHREQLGIINRQKRKKTVNADNVSTDHPLHRHGYNFNRKRTFDDSSTSAKRLQHGQEILSKRNKTKDDGDEINTNHSHATKKNNVGNSNNLSDQQNIKIQEQIDKTTSPSAQNSTHSHSFFYRICSGVGDVNTPIEDHITNVIDPSTNTSASISTNIQNISTLNPEMVINNQKSSRVKIISQKIIQASANNAASESKNSEILANSTDTCSKTHAREILLTAARHITKYENQSLTLNGCDYNRDSTCKIISQKSIEGMPESSLVYRPYASEISPATANQSSGVFIENTSTRKDYSCADISAIDEAPPTKTAVTTPGNISSELPPVKTIAEQAVMQKFKNLFEQVTCKLLDSFMESQEGNQQFDETCNFAIELITSLSDLRKSINPVEPTETVMESSTATDLKQNENKLLNCSYDTNLENIYQSATYHCYSDLKIIDKPSDGRTSIDKHIEKDNNRNIDDSALVLHSWKYTSQEYTNSSNVKQKQTSDNNCDVNNERMKERLINDIASTSTEIPREYEGATELNYNDEENNNDDNAQAVDDNEESHLIEIPNKKSQIILPADYDPNDSKWTLKYRHIAPGFIELLPGSEVYVDERELKIILDESRDYKTLARKLLSAVFTPRALSVCSLTGTRNSSGPGLDKHAVSVLLKYVIKTGHEYKLSPCPMNLISQSLRGKLADMRRKFSTASNEFWAEYNQ